MKTGKLCPLPKLISLRKRYKLRIFIDESISFGTLGNNGKGITEHFNIPVSILTIIIYYITTIIIYLMFIFIL